MEKTAFKLTAADELIREFCQDYMEKLFYFCLKKTGNPNEAEDLCSDISLQIIAGLKKGTLPENFPAWVWQISRNRYRLWAIKKHRAAELYDSEAETDEIPDDTIGVEDELILAEDMNLLRRELAFIQSDYRNILVAYYIEDRGIKDISDSLDLPEGTVKSKLYRARKLLKEGINMAREFGPKSYKPENVTFNASGDIRSGLPWKAVERKVQKNILLEASNNPCTVEELAIALGISVPYMEEEVEILIHSTLLKKVGNKYVTNFPILSTDVQRKIYDAQKNRAKERAELVASIARDSVAKIRALGCVRNGKITDEELVWWAVSAVSHVSSMDSSDYRVTVRENGERWGFVGYEESGLPGTGGLSNSNCGDWKKVVLRHFTVHNFRIGQDDRHPYDRYNHTLLLADIIKNNRNISSFNDAETELWKNIDGLYAHADENGNVIPDILIFEGGGYYSDVPDLAVQIFTAHPDFKKLMELDRSMHLVIVEILKKESSPVIAEQLNFVASMANRIEGMSFNEIVNTGKISVPDDPEHCKAVIDLWIA